MSDMSAALDSIFSALADSTRRAMLARLAKGEATITELAAPFSISQPAISRHIRVLEQAGLIRRRVDGPHRPCRLAPGAFDHLDAYLTVLRKGMECNYQRLDRLLAHAPSPRRKDKA
jgi:DNA-binding transcriptional ArsR family regulator